jgi:hypothetical protein
LYFFRWLIFNIHVYIQALGSHMNTSAIYNMLYRAKNLGLWFVLSLPNRSWLACSSAIQSLVFFSTVLSNRRCHRRILPVGSCFFRCRRQSCFFRCSRCRALLLPPPPLFSTGGRRLRQDRACRRSPSSSASRRHKLCRVLVILIGISSMRVDQGFPPRDWACT